MSLIAELKRRNVFRVGVLEETPRLLLYGVWNDPYALYSLHNERPNLAEKYTKFLEVKPVAHLALQQRLTRGADAALIANQLRTLGYIG